MHPCRTIGAAALTAGLGLAGSAAAQVPESEDPIKLTLHDWTGQYITTEIMGRVLQSMGYNVEYVQADYIAQFAGLEAGDLHVAMEMWETTGKDAMAASLATGKTVDLGETGMQAKEEWWYPAYMKEQCPGLPNWETLNDCAEAFATPETSPSGRYLGGPVTWGGYDDERAEALGLDYEVVHAGTDAALFAELESAYQRKAPFLGWIYTPHWAPIVRGRMGRVPRIRRCLLPGPELGREPGHGVRLRQTAWLDQEGRLEGGRGEMALRLRGDPRLQDRQPDHGQPDRQSRSRRGRGVRRGPGVARRQPGHLEALDRLRRLSGASALLTSGK
jgi:glycine betaine/proline transport system substrate-binding protein